MFGGNLSKKGTIVTSGLKTYTTSQNVKRYCGFYGIRQTDLASCESGAPYSGHLKLLKVRVYNGTFDGIVTVKFVINGVPTGNGITIPVSTAEGEFTSSEIIEFSKGDLLAFEVDVQAGAGNYRLSSYHEIEFDNYLV